MSNTITAHQLITIPLEPVLDHSVLGVLYKASRVSSRTEKEAILASCDNPSLLRAIQQDTYGPARYHVKDYSVPGTGKWNIDKDYAVFQDLLACLSQRLVTGNMAKEAVGKCLSQFDHPSQLLLARVLDKNWRIGVGNASASDSGSVQKFPVRLAKSYKDYQDKVDLFDGNWRISRKLDGVRLLTFIDSDGNGNVDVHFKSRQDKEITTLGKLVPIYQDLFLDVPGHFVVDGEICVLDESGGENFHHLMSEITRKDHTLEHPCHLVYDFLTQDEFFGKKESPKLDARLEKACSILGEMGSPIYPPVQVLEQQVLESPQHLEGLIRTAREKGWEGLMVAKDVPYQGKRNSNLLKIKDFCDGEYVVEDIEVAKMSRSTQAGTQIVETVAALVIRHKGNRVLVGSGLSWAQRDEWYEDPSKIVGKTVTIRYFEETMDKKTGLPSLRFPTLYHVHGDRREV